MPFAADGREDNINGFFDAVHISLFFLVGLFCLVCLTIKTIKQFARLSTKSYFFFPFTDEKFAIGV
jgi:hypothetical protein